MGKYTKLLISKEQVEDAITEFGKSRSDKFILMPPKVMNSGIGQTRYSINLGDSSFEIDFYYRSSDNKTTIKEIGSDSNKLMGIELAEYIYNQLEYSEIQQGTLTIKTTEQIFDNLIVYLTGIKGVNVVKNENDSIKILKQLVSETGDKITLTYYKSSGKMVYQGTFFKLYAEVQCFLNPLGIVVDTIVDKRVLDKNGVDLLVHKAIPNAYDNIDINLRDYLYDSFVHIKNNLECKDYSLWTFPALKGLEALIKQLLLKNGTIMDDNKGFSLYSHVSGKVEPIFIRNSRSGIYELNTMLVTAKDNSFKTALSETYDYFNKNRHVLFHTKQLLQTTPRLNSSSEAEVIIYKVCELFNGYYELLL